MRQHWILLSALLLGCSSEQPAEAPDKPEVPTKTETAAKPVKNFKLDIGDLKKGAEEVALVPSPAEMQKTLKNTGLESKLGKMVSAESQVSMDGVENKDQIAVRTGVVLAELVLTVQSSSKEVKVDRLTKLKEGFVKLGAGADINDTIDDTISSIKNEAVTNDDLLKEMDELSGVLMPELEYEAGEWVVPLIQAGSWLQGSYLVSGAIIEENKFDAASTLLRQPAVADYFLKYVQREGKEKAPDEVVKQLENTLIQLKEIASKDSLTEDDVKAIRSSTGDVLKLL